MQLLVSLFLPFFTLATPLLIPRPTEYDHEHEAPLTGATYPWKIPTIHESAVMARRILTLNPEGTLSTTFTHSSPSSNLTLTPKIPIGMPDYLAPCDPIDASNPILLATMVATTFRNTEAGSNISLTVHWTPPTPRQWDTLMSLPRFSILGHLQPIPEDELKDGQTQACFLKHHPDARAWLPGNRIHKSEWMRLVVEGVYWVGGFGDRAYIGWIPVEEWQGVTQKEVDEIRLPGEQEKEAQGWRGWLLGGSTEELR